MASRICRKCRWPNPPGAVTCERCGALLDSSGFLLIILAVLYGLGKGLYRLYRWAAKRFGWPIPGFILRWEEKKEREAKEAEEAAKLAAEQAQTQAADQAALIAQGQANAARFQADMKVPFPWEGEVQSPPTITPLDELSDLKGLTQAHLDAYTATAKEFWVCFHQSLGAPYSAFSAHRTQSLRHFATALSSSMQIPLAGLGQYPILKGEFPIAMVGPHVLTNYRLQMLIDQIRISIPLENLTRYTLSGGPLDLHWTEGGQAKSLSITGTVILASFVDSARGAKAWESLDNNQRLLLLKSSFEFKQLVPDLTITDAIDLDVREGLEDTPTDT